MSSIESKLALLKKHLESAAFLVGKEGAEKDVHSEVIQSLIIVSELEGLSTKQAEPILNKVADINEVEKVNRRLRLWAKRQNQINSRILNAFLKLKRSGLTVITESDLRGEFLEEKSFDSNFLQMKIIAEKNHGKVFDQYGEIISIWRPVADGVELT